MTKAFQENRNVTCPSETKKGRIPRKEKSQVTASMLQNSTHGKGNALGERNNVWWYFDSSVVTNQERVLFAVFKSTHFQPNYYYYYIINRLNPQILWKLRYKINLTPPQYWANVGNSIKPSRLMFLFLDFKTSKTLVIGSFYFLVLLS